MDPERYVDPDTDVCIRALVAPKEAGIIIGRGGQQVASLRATTGVRAGISKAQQRVHRVLTLTGPLQGVAQAVAIIAQSFLDASADPSGSLSHDSPPPTPTDASVCPPGSSGGPAPDSPAKPDMDVPDGTPGAEQHSPAPATPAESKDATMPSLSSPTTSTAEEPSTTTVRILLSHVLVGAVIGKQGATIKMIQECSGARMVVSKGMLPNSTERVIDITGTPSAIHMAVGQVAQCVACDAERAQGTVYYEPDPTDGPASTAIGVPYATTASSSALAATLRSPKREWCFSPVSEPFLPTVAHMGPAIAHPHAHPHALDLFGASAANYRYSAHIASLQHQRVFPPTGIPSGSATSPAAIARAAAQGAAVAPGGGFVAGGITGLGPATAPAVVDAANLRTQNISIPADMVGCIIGKAGSRITEIRRLSGSRISIAKVSHTASGERLFTIQGTPASNEKALYLMYNQLETEKERRQSAAAPAAPMQNAET